MSGPTLLSFHRLNFLRLLRSLGLPRGKTRDVIDASIYKPKFSRKLRETTKITIRNKLLIISEDFYDNLRFQHIQIAQIHLDTDRPQWKFHEFRWHRKWRAKRAMRSSSIVIPNYGHSYSLLKSFQTSMSVLKISAAVTRTIPYVQIPWDHSNAFVSRDS